VFLLQGLHVLESSRLLSWSRFSPLKLQYTCSFSIIRDCDNPFYFSGWCSSLLLLLSSSSSSSSFQANTDFNDIPKFLVLLFCLTKELNAFLPHLATVAQ
jgi:hypothetical protein